jgi:hypothetical protein
MRVVYCSTLLAARAHIDAATAVSARSTVPDDALAFIRYITPPEATAVWKAKGLNRF